MYPNRNSSFFLILIPEIVTEQCEIGLNRISDLLDLGVGGALVGHKPAEPAGRLRAPPEDRERNLRGRLQGRQSVCVAQIYLIT